MKQYFTAEITAMFSKVPIVKNLARQKFVLMFVLGPIRSRKVQFCEVAQYLNGEAQDKSNEVPIQNFFVKRRRSNQKQPKNGGNHPISGGAI